jgi:HSP20 family molecular chaperone IbpA
MIPEFRKLETAIGLRVWAKVPGLRIDDIEITAEGHMVRIAGTSSSTKGAFEAYVEVHQEFNVERARAEYFDEELRIAVPRR